MTVGEPGPSQAQQWPWTPIAAEPPSPPPASDPLTSPEPPPRRPRRLGRSSPRTVVAIGVLLVLLGVTAVAVDWRNRNHELAALTSQMETAQAVLRPIKEKSGDVVQDCIDGVPCDIAGLGQLARDDLPLVSAAARAVVDVSVGRFDAAIRGLRDDFIRFVLAWQSWIAVLAVTPHVVLNPAPTAIDAALRRAGRSAGRAVPPFAKPGLRLRLQYLFPSAGAT